MPVFYHAGGIASAVTENPAIWWNPVGGDCYVQVQCTTACPQGPHRGMQ
jgi:hypothetical protein